VNKQIEMGQPDVSIIVLNWNKSALTLNCLQSIQRGACSNNYEVIIIDNGSAAAELALLKEGLGRDDFGENFRLISLAQNMFFGEGCNIGAEAARGQFLLFLNNDVTVTQGAVDSLVSQFKSAFSPGAIGPKFLYPNGTLQEAGAFVLPDGRTIQQGKEGTQPDPHFAHGTHIVDYCSAACLLVGKNVFMAHGGFDPIFDPAYFEDVDLCFRLRASGLYTYYASDVTIYHEENATSSALWSRDEIVAIATKNHQRFVQRWSEHLKNRLQVSGQRIQQLPPTLDAQPPPFPSASFDRAGSVLLQCATILQDSADSAAMLRCAAALQDKYDVTLAVPEICSHLRIDSLSRELGCHLSRYKIARLTEIDRSSYDHTISFPGSAFGEDAPMSNLDRVKLLLGSI
jgi:GT2 family glycosyltransferase